MQTELLIDNQARAASSNATFERLHPTSGDVVTRAAAGTVQDAVAAADSASVAYQSWKNSPPSERRRILLKAADALEALKQQPSSFELFKRNSTVHQGGDFGLASCAETDGELMMVLVTYSTQGVNKQVGLPFLEWDSSSFEAFSGQTCLVLNTSVVNEKTIQLMRESAGDKVQLAIAKYRI